MTNAAQFALTAYPVDQFTTSFNPKDVQKSLVNGETMLNTSERIAECFDGLAENYENRVPKHRWFPPEWIPRHVQDIQGIEHCEVLDLGCGTGLNITVLCEHRERIRATGVDVSPRMLELVRASNRYNKLYSHDCTKSLPTDISSGTFDLVIVLGVFEYLTEISACLSECHRVLKPDGILWSSFRSFEPNDEGSPPRQVSFNGIDIVHHSREEILHMMQRASMQVIDVELVPGFVSDAGFIVPYYVVRARKPL
jgi:predicted TPR repeat methyltransferase